MTPRERPLTVALGPAPDAWQVKQRVRWLLAMVPYGRVLTYSDALAMVGAPAGFARALPSYLKAWANEAAPAAEVSGIAAADEAAVEAVPTGELVEVVGMRKLEVKRLQRGLGNVDL